MTLRGNSNKSSASGSTNAPSAAHKDSTSSSGSGSLAAALGRGDGQRHGSTESTDTVRGPGVQRGAGPMRVNTGNKKLAQ
jgi:hypothetical protein